MYWRIGRAIIDRLATEAYGTAVIDRLSRDLRRAVPGTKRLSPRNLVYMRSFAQAWPEEVLQQAAAKLPWAHIMVLLDKLDTRSERDWYAAKDLEHGWSRNVLIPPRHQGDVHR